MMKIMQKYGKIHGRVSNETKSQDEIPLNTGKVKISQLNFLFL